MKGKQEIGPDLNTKKETNRINRDAVVFAFFLLLSFIFWYLNSLGNEVEADIRYPMKYINLPGENEVTEESKEKLTLFLKGPGYAIFKLKVAGNRSPVLIDISKVIYKRVPGSRTLSYYIVTSGLNRSISIQLRSGCEVTSIKPDTLFFTIDKPATK